MCVYSPLNQRQPEGKLATFRKHMIVMQWLNVWNGSKGFDLYVCVGVDVGVCF